MNAVVGSGLSSMSDSWISWKPRIEEPSKPMPSLEQIRGESPAASIEKCCAGDPVATSDAHRHNRARSCSCLWTPKSPAHSRKPFNAASRFDASLRPCVHGCSGSAPGCSSAWACYAGDGDAAASRSTPARCTTTRSRRAAGATGCTRHRACAMTKARRSSSCCTAASNARWASRRPADGCTSPSATASGCCVRTSAGSPTLGAAGTGFTRWRSAAKASCWPCYA